MRSFRPKKCSILPDLNWQRARSVAQRQLYTVDDGIKRQLYLRFVIKKKLPEVCCASLLLRELLLSICQINSIFWRWCETLSYMTNRSSEVLTSPPLVRLSVCVNDRLSVGRGRRNVFTSVRLSVCFHSWLKVKVIGGETVYAWWRKAPDSPTVSIWGVLSSPAVSWVSWCALGG